MRQIDLQQAKEKFLELVELAASGQEVIISKDKEPFVKLVSAGRLKGRRQFGSASGLIKTAADLNDPLADFQEYM
jgi:prevent-host-death family protein